VLCVNYHTLDTIKQAVGSDERDLNLICAYASLSHKYEVLASIKGSVNNIELHRM